MFLEVIDPIINFIYPNRCFHCSSKLKKGYFYFCEECLFYFYLNEPNVTDNFMAIFENRGPLATFLKEVKKQNIYSFIKMAAAFVVIKYFSLNWDFPDVIMNISKNRFFKDHAYYLSKEVSKIIKRRIVKKSHSGQVVLLVQNKMDYPAFLEVKKKFLYKKIYCVSLSFDIFFDHFNLFE